LYKEKEKHAVSCIPHSLLTCTARVCVFVVSELSVFGYLQEGSDTRFNLQRVVIRAYFCGLVNLIKKIHCCVMDITNVRFEGERMK